jgi:hypothetical protein
VNGRERRKSPRHVVDLPARCTTDGVSFPGRVKDICRDAALVEAHHPCPVEARIVLAMTLPGGDTLELAGRVIRVAPGEGDARGLAVVFTDATPAAATRIDLLLSTLP